MDILKTLRATAALSVLGTIGLATIGDVETESITQAAVSEKRSLTKAEIEHIKGPNVSLYLAAGSVPAWLLLRYMDEKKLKQSSN